MTRSSRTPRGISKDMRLRQRVDFLAVQDGGLKLHGRHVLGIARQRATPDLPGRLGLTVTKKVGISPVRNRIRRMLREWLRTNAWVPTGWDLVLVAKDSASAQLRRDDFAADLTKILRQVPVRS